MLHIITHYNNNTCNFMIDIYTIYIYCNGKPTMQLLSILAELPSKTRCLQVEDETWTVLAIGPDASKKIDMVTGTPVSGMVQDGMMRCFFVWLIQMIPAMVGHGMLKRFNITASQTEDDGKNTMCFVLFPLFGGDIR